MMDDKGDWMQKEYSLSWQMAIVGLDGQLSSHGSAEKRAAVRGIAAAMLLEKLMLQEENDLAKEELERKLKTGLEEIKHLKKRDGNRVEEEVAGALKKEGILQTVPSLLCCDINYETTGLQMEEYRSDADAYLSVTESIRGEILEEGPVTRECICLLWLFRETGCIHEIFSVREQEQIRNRMMDLLLSDEVCAVLWRLEFCRSSELFVKSFLKGKRKLFRNPYLEGVNLLFPFLDRRQAVFIDFVVLGTDVKRRRQAVMTYLAEKGHSVKEVKNGTETLLKIDNMYYRIWPKTLVINRVPVQGANLQPVYR